jgi:hypothetical protein
MGGNLCELARSSFRLLLPCTEDILLIDSVMRSDSLQAKNWNCMLKDEEMGCGVSYPLPPTTDWIRPTREDKNVRCRIESSTLISFVCNNESLAMITMMTTTTKMMMTCHRHSAQKKKRTEFNRILKAYNSSRSNSGSSSSSSSSYNINRMSSCCASCNSDMTWKES